MLAEDLTSRIPQQPGEFPNDRLTTATYDANGNTISSQGSAGVPPASSSSVFYQYDGLGSVRSITDENGDLKETYDYDAYGTLIGLAKRNATTGVLESSPTANNPSLLTSSQYLYTGEQWDADLGMYFLRARYLSTNTGRFHTLDTYEGRNGEPLTLHKYLYVHGNPVNGIDPSGHFLIVELIVTYAVESKLHSLDRQRVQSQSVVANNGLKQFVNQSGRVEYNSAKRMRETLQRSSYSFEIL